MSAPRIAFIGFGEAGGAFAEGWGAEIAARSRAFDVKTEDPATAPAMEARYDAHGVIGASSRAEALDGAEIVFSVVTADQAFAAAEACAPFLAPGAYWCDLNSAAPATKRRAAALIEAAGGRYVDVAVMAPVRPKRHLTPLLIAGPAAEALAPTLAALPADLRVVGETVGAASSIKMIRSIMVKGMEALTAECALAAVAAGVEEEVFASLMKSHPGVDWPAQASYNFERAMVHGARRAAEMEEVVTTVEDLGLPAEMAAATVRWQRRLAATGAPAPESPRETPPRAIAELLLPRLRR